MVQSDTPHISDAEPAIATDGWYLEGCLSDQQGLTKISLGKSRMTIGRSPGADLCVPSRNVSKLHAEITVAGDVVILKDTGSTNGTFVNGQRINNSTPVGEGDLLQFADTEFRLGRTRETSGHSTMVWSTPEDGWLISRLAEVVNERRFQMVYQPIFDVQGQQSFAVEALVRCQVSGLESPLKLFEAAERLGLEENISRLCRSQAVTSLGTYAAGRKLFVNTHPHELRGSELIESLEELRNLAGDRQLVLEIHEAAVPERTAMTELRQALRSFGIELAYDDFGAGQSRLLELTQAPPDYLKFDRSLLHDLPQSSRQHQSLIQALVKHASEAGIVTVAEGIDNSEAAQMCRDLGFSYIQGFLFAKPMPAPELDAR